MMTNNILFLGNFFPNEYKNTIHNNSRESIQYAANTLQWDYIKGIENVINDNIDLITMPIIGTWPKGYKKIIVHQKSFLNGELHSCKMVGFINLPIIRQLTSGRNLYYWVKKWAETDCDGEKTIIAYSYRVSGCLGKIKKRYPKINCILVLPDLPEFTYMNHSDSMIYGYLRKYNQKVLASVINYFNRIVVITRQMAERLCIEDKSIVIEGMVDSSRSDKKFHKSDDFNIAYTGTLTRAYGVMDLVNAVLEIGDPNLFLTICGGGETESEIREISEKNSNIIYKGMVSPQEAQLVQQKSDLLVNPRKNDKEYTQYSFPSKILQYMRSGTPVLCYRLDGIPEEYDKYLLYIDANEKLAVSIKRIMNMDRMKLFNFGITASEFVASNKNNTVQCKKIVDFLR